jgi:phospholipid/cholesterol/gamma-HCH transport system substrate-binding protein
MARQNIHSTEIKVGLFVFVLLVVAAAVIFTIGSERRLFERQTRLVTRFPDVGGLEEGAMVRVGGVTVGTVSKIHFSQDPNDASVVVEFRVASSVVPRIRQDSVCRLETMGLLGDMTLAINIGSQGPPVHDGQSMPGVPTPNIAQVEAEAADTVHKLRDAASTIDDATRQLLNPKSIADILTLLDSTALVMRQVSTGPGFVHDLFYSTAISTDMRNLLGGASAAVTDVVGATSDFRAYLHRATTEHGAEHLLANASQAAGNLSIASASLAHAADSISGLSDAVQTQAGVLHALVYDPQGKQAIARLLDAANTVHQLVEGVAQGHGTLGALLVDPTLYEETKALVVDIRRSWAVRNLVRFVIRNDEGQGDDHRAP